MQEGKSMNARNDRKQLAPLVRWPAGKDMRVPYQVFTDRSIFDLEQQTIFHSLHWSYVALEAEIPEPGDYKSTYVGDTPVVVTRGKQGELHAWVNRCAHRGAMVCRDRCGKAQRFTCVYHQWTYDAAGSLASVPFRHGVQGKGGMPKDFELSAHSLTRLWVASYRGLIFVTFAGEAEVEALEQYLGPDVCRMLDRIFTRPISLLGDERQVMHGKAVLRKYPRRLPRQPAAPVSRHLRHLPLHPAGFDCHR